MRSERTIGASQLLVLLAGAEHGNGRQAEAEFPPVHRLREEDGFVELGGCIDAVNHSRRRWHPLSLAGSDDVRRGRRS